MTRRHNIIYVIHKIMGGVREGGDERHDSLGPI